MGKRVSINCERCQKPFEVDIWRTLPTTAKRYHTRFCSRNCGRRRHPPADERFFNKVEKLANDCWQWTGSINNSGYAQFWELGRNTIKAHRWAFERWKGPVPEGKILLHSCDNRRCVNPAHLRPGTSKENSQEAVARNRYTKVGGQLPKAKAAALKKLLLAGMPKDQIAIALGIERKTVKRWASALSQQVTKDE